MSTECQIFLIPISHNIHQYFVCINIYIYRRREGESGNEEQRWTEEEKENGRRGRVSERRQIR